MDAARRQQEQNREGRGNLQPTPTRQRNSAVHVCDAWLLVNSIEEKRVVMKEEQKRSRDRE